VVESVKNIPKIFWQKGKEHVNGEEKTQVLFEAQQDTNKDDPQKVNAASETQPAISQTDNRL
jgi:hypothetical protein